MVRVNIINPKFLADQHLVAEYNEILMLVAYLKKHQNLDDIPPAYCLGKGHMKFFKNRVLYLIHRHKLLKKEMALRGFKQRKKINPRGFKKKNLGNWEPKETDFKVIRKRLIHKISIKPGYYRYLGNHRPKQFFIDLINRKH